MANNIADAFNDIGTPWNKNDVCRGLDMVDQNCSEWYEEINYILPPSTNPNKHAHFIKSFDRFVHSNVREPVMDTSPDFLNKLQCGLTVHQEHNIFDAFIRGKYKKHSATFGTNIRSCQGKENALALQIL